MQFISCHDGKLQRLEAAGLAGLKASPARAFVTGMPALDALAPGKSFARGAVHELLFDPSHGRPQFFAALIARGTSLPVIWSDPRCEIYPPALTALGFDLSNVYLLRPRSLADEAWAVTECLRCRGVGAVIAAAPEKLSRIQARRFQ